MLTFILMVSFLIHIILFIVIYYLFAQIQLLKKGHSKEIEDLFDRYLQEIKQENIRLENSFSEKGLGNDQQPVADKEIKAARENVMATNTYSPQIDIVNDQFESSLESQILQLYDQGMTAEEIAKKLDCGKTEAALVIKISGKKGH